MFMSRATSRAHSTAHSKNDLVLRPCPLRSGACPAPELDVVFATHNRVDVVRSYSVLFYVGLFLLQNVVFIPGQVGKLAVLRRAGCSVPAQLQGR